MKKKPLKYTMISRLKFGEWITGSILTSFKKAHEYAMNTSNEGLCCVMHVTRGGEFEYEKRYYGLSESQKIINNLPK